MKEILIKDYGDDNMAISYEKGEMCKKFIIECLKTDNIVTLNFKGIEFSTITFLNSILGDLILQYGNNIMKFIQIKNANKSIIEKIELIETDGLIKREDLDK